MERETDYYPEIDRGDSIGTILNEDDSDEVLRERCMILYDKLSIRGFDITSGQIETNASRKELEFYLYLNTFNYNKHLTDTMTSDTTYLVAHILKHLMDDTLTYPTTYHKGPTNTS